MLAAFGASLNWPHPHTSNKHHPEYWYRSTTLGVNTPLLEPGNEAPIAEQLSRLTPERPWAMASRRRHLAAVSGQPGRARGGVATGACSLRMQYDVRLEQTCFVPL